MVHLKLYGSYSQSSLAKDSYAFSLFIQDVFKMDRKHQKASQDLVHPIHRSKHRANDEHTPTSPNVGHDGNDAAPRDHQSSAAQSSITRA